MKLTHQQIADYASLTRETVSRVLKNLEKEGLISILENKTILLNNTFAEGLTDAMRVKIRPSLDLVGSEENGDDI